MAGRATRIKGMPVILYEKVCSDTDPFGRELFTETAVTVDNVIVSPVSSQESISILDLTGKKVEYTLGIPKGDTHIWEDRYVGFFGHRWHVVNIPIEGIEENVPLDWHKTIMVERYE